MTDAQRFKDAFDSRQDKILPWVEIRHKKLALRSTWAQDFPKANIIVFLGDFGAEDPLQVIYFGDYSEVFLINSGERHHQATVALKTPR